MGLTQPLTEMSTRNIFWWGKGGRCVGPTNKSFMCRFSWNLEASNSWQLKGRSKPVKRLLYLWCTFNVFFVN